MISNVLFSSKSDEWSTPQTLFDTLNEEFHFTLDPCATDENAKCKMYYTISENGLENYRYETGDSTPSLIVMQKLAQFYQMDPKKLFF